jgi:hypothetical protein
MSIVWLGLLAWIAFDALVVAAMVIVSRRRERRIRGLALELARAAETHANSTAAPALHGPQRAAAALYQQRLG